MIRKIAVGACVVFALLAAAPAAVAADGPDGASANGSKTGYGNTKTGGQESPQMSLIQGTLNKPCLGIGKLGVQSLIALINVGVQDVPILSSQQQQQCTDNSTINDGDDPLSHILDEIPVVSGNGSANG
ncbi:rodlin [Streptomyces sp. NPDC001492]